MSGRMRLRRRHALVAVVAVVLLSLASSAFASASAVTMTSALRPFATAQVRCTSQSVAVTTATTSGTSSTLTVSNLDTVGCSGRPLVVAVYDPAVGTWAAAKKIEISGAVTASSVTLVSSTATFTPTTSLKAYVTIDDWQVPATWSYTPPTPANATCVVINPSGNVVNGKSCAVAFGPDTDASDTGWNIKATITTTSSAAVLWRVTIDFASVPVPFPFVANRVGEYTGAPITAPLGAGFCSGATRVVTFTGNPAQGKDTVAAGSPVVLDLVGSSGGSSGNTVYSCP